MSVDACSMAGTPEDEEELEMDTTQPDMVEGEELMDATYFGKDDEEDEEEDEDTIEMSSDEYDENNESFDYLEDDMSEKPHEFLLADVEMAVKKAGRVSEKGVAVVEMLDHISPTTCTIIIRLKTSKLDEFLREKWGIERDAIELHIVEVSKARFRAMSGGEILPQVEIPFAHKECVVTHQIANFVRCILQDQYATGGCEEIMNPTEYGSFFVYLLKEMNTRLETLTEFCMICNKQLPAAGLMPSICVQDLCTYQYHELKLYDGMTTPRVTPEVLELLLVLMSRANETTLESKERKQAMRPDPHQSITECPPAEERIPIDAEDYDKWLDEQEKRFGETVEPLNCRRRWLTHANDFHIEQALSREMEEKKSEWRKQYEEEHMQKWAPLEPVSNTTRRVASLRDPDIGRSEKDKPDKWTSQNTLDTLIASIPCTRQIISNPAAYKRFKKHRPRAAQFVEWLVISLPAYLHQVPRRLNVKAFKCDHQFVVLADTPKKHARFNELKKCYDGGKTQFYFHGSPISNWHSILRSGLENYSNTEFQIHGAAHGAGIYLSNHLGHSVHYATRGYKMKTVREEEECASECCAGHHPMATRASVVIAVCEVVPHGIKSTSHSQYFTAPDPDFVCVRMLLVMENVQPLDAYQEITDVDVREIRNVLDSLTRKGSFHERVHLLRHAKAEEEE